MGTLLKQHQTKPHTQHEKRNSLVAAGSKLQHFWIPCVCTLSVGQYKKHGD